MAAETAFVKDCGTFAKLIAKEPALPGEILELASACLGQSPDKTAFEEFFLGLDALVDAGSKRLVTAALCLNDKELLNGVKDIEPTLQRDAEHRYSMQVSLCKQRGGPFKTLLDLPTVLLVVHKLLEPLRDFYARELGESEEPAAHAAASIEILRQLERKIAVERGDQRES